MTMIITGADELKAHVGEELGESWPVIVPQDAVDDFARLTRDYQWIHTDPARAAAGPFGGTIVHGFLTLSLATTLLWDVAVVDGFDAVLNYGLNRVRFPTPLPVGQLVRAAVTLVEARDIPGGVEAVWRLTFRAEGVGKPVCVADIVFRYYGAQR